MCIYEEKVQQRWRYKDQRQANLRANVEDNRSDVKVVPEERESKSLVGGRSKAIRSDAVECGHIPNKNQSDMVAVMSKLLRQQAAPDVNTDIFTRNPVDYHCFIAVFDEVVEKKIDDSGGRLTRLIKYTDGQPKEMIKHVSSNQQLWVTRIQDHLRKSMGIHIKSWQLTTRKSNPGQN